VHKKGRGRFCRGPFIDILKGQISSLPDSRMQTSVISAAIAM
jgi:hypothetical protein